MEKMLYLIKNLSLSILLATIGCGKMESAKRPNVFVDYAFYEILAEYKAEKKHYLGTDATRPIHIMFVSLAQDNADGRCMHSGDYRLIQIDPATWLFGSYYDRIAIFYHEMGHCDLDIWNHSEEYTIMYQSGVDGYQLRLAREYYMSLLFLERK